MGDLYFDDVVLVKHGAEGLNLLRNGSGEVSRLRIWPHLERLARHVPLKELFDGQSYDRASLNRYFLYVLLTFAGFWANFGWLTVPLHILWYGVLALLSFVALVGLGIGSIKAMITWSRADSKPLPWRCKALVLLLVGTCLVVSQTFLPMIGRDWQPQGRYLLPGIIPIATLFSFGWREVMPRQWHKLLVVGWIAAFFLLDSLCLLGYVVPYFYG